MELDGRLEMLLQLAGEGEVLADIGSDHGRLPGQALQRGWKRAIVTDISGASLAKARRHLAGLHLSQRADFRLGDGLGMLVPGEAEVAVISGLGSLVIRGMLERGFPVERAVLQPMRDEDQLRGFLLESGFRIAREGLARVRGRWYVAMLVEKGQEMPRSPMERRIGWRLMEDKHPLLHPYMQNRIAGMERALPRASDVYRKELEGELEAWRREMEKLFGRGIC